MLSSPGQYFSTSRYNKAMNDALQRLQIVGSAGLPQVQSLTSKRSSHLPDTGQTNGICMECMCHVCLTQSSLIGRHTYSTSKHLPRDIKFIRYGARAYVPARNNAPPGLDNAYGAANTFSGR